MAGFEENEISVNANGGTEIAKRKLAQIIDPELLQDTQIICSRIRELDPSKIRIFWCHDLPEDPESSKLKDKSYRDQFHHFVFISDWQYQQYRTILGFPYSENCTVIESGFEPIESNIDTKFDSDRTVFTYTSTPQRGLGILVPVFDALAQKYPDDDIHLEVFSSFKIYGWDDADKQFEPLYDQIRSHPMMTYRGFVDNETLKKFLAEEAHIFAYPCTWVETSCRAMLESMSAGLACVHPNYGALPETSGGLNFMYQGDSDIQRHARIFFNELDQVYSRIKTNRKEMASYLKYVKNYTDHRYNITRIKQQWENLLTNLHEKYSIEERKLPTPTFSYKTI
jgi:UDP-glucose:(glucosyl)LPS alpha-1,2-glucosyltransferase